MKCTTKVLSGYLVFQLLQSSAWGVLVATPNPGNLPTSPPANGAPWANVLLTNNNSSSVYLGAGWVLTAEHVFDDQANPFVTHNSITYFADLTNSHVLNNPAFFPGLGLTAQADLVLFKLTAQIPSLPTITLGKVSANLPITMIGFGGGKSWGTNTVQNTTTLDIVNLPNPDNDFIAFHTDYDVATQTEAQGTGGDSGGGAFAFQSGQWRLVGTLLAIDTASDPDRTFFADVNTYASQINALVPEPSALLLTASALLLLLRRRRC